jgi:hypothetical protein
MTQKELMELLRYDPTTGDFFWKVKPAKQIAVGSKAGYSQNGYVFIRLKGTLYYAHRLAVLYMTGAWPTEVVDHDNRNKADNRWANLNSSTAQQNRRNASLSKNSTSGVTGVCWDRRKAKWTAHITIAHKRKFLGYFDNIPAAASARQAANHLYGFHQNHGKT